MSNLFEVLVLIGLVVLIVLAVAAIFTRRHRAGVHAPESGTADAGAEVDARARESVLDARRAEVDRHAAQARSEAEQLRSEADAYHRDVRGRADEMLREAQTARAELRDTRAELDRREQRLTERETRLDDEGKALHDRAQRLDQLEADLNSRQETLAAADTERLLELERVGGLTGEQAKSELISAVEHDAKRQAMILSRDIETRARREAEDRAREIVVTAVQRIASDQTSESVVSAVHLPGDDMKGRIIGREGRNIRSFEQVTGVNVLIDDTPESVLLSSFDPVRRETARITLVELIEDGRIHPARIEEVHERSKAKIADQVMRAAEDALAEVGIADLHPDLVPIVGTLRYRTSYGQNVLKHLVESAHIASVMAAELHLDVATVKRAAFLHDIGKALTHEVEGSHALIGADLARRYGEHPDIVHAIEAHHNEVEPTTVEAVLTQAADAISGGRPGARRESLEAYVKRLERLEQIAQAHDGVEKVFAMQAGREVRVMVAPDVVDDIEAQVLARDIAKQIEEELTYPGQIKVSVIRESRAVETAR
ncbi:ribonuclease Y [Microlunatus endophyticus]|uniref:Ribonuclease Y n=1 Tax=Microlunatus endophyticus TaxID=1716077 RepID=A0A917S1H8_9ACTN|nr:ribonuclease Y [Microlunatus endophyticus]GGL50577.1 ribonuclease Y [Microlunatus endophyticus]